MLTEWHCAAAARAGSTWRTYAFKAWSQPFEGTMALAFPGQ